MNINQYSSNASLELLNSEASSLLDEAKKYRAEMDKLPQGDPNRKVYEQIIRDLLKRSRKLSDSVSTTARST